MSAVASVPSALDTEAVYRLFVVEYGSGVFKAGKHDKCLDQFADMTGSRAGIVSVDDLRAHARREGDGSDAEFTVFMRSLVGDSEYFDFYDFLYMRYLQKAVPDSSQSFAAAAVSVAVEMGVDPETLSIDVGSSIARPLPVCRVVRPYSSRRPLWRL